jgi:hypothetical protein
MKKAIQHPGRNKGGRPSKITRPDVQARILEAIRIGSTRRGAAGYAGISEDSLQNLLKSNSAFSEELKKAEAAVEPRMLSFIVKAANGGNWQASAWILERRLYNDYGKREPDRVASQTNEVKIVVVYADKKEIPASQTVEIGGNGRRAMQGHLAQAAPGSNGGITVIRPA